MAEITTTAHFSPGAPNKNNAGPMYAPGQHDDLLLPNGSTVGQTSNEVLRPMLARFVEGTHTRPRNEIVAEYAATLKRIHDDAGSRAVSQWLEEHRG